MTKSWIYSRVSFSLCVDFILTLWIVAPHHISSLCPAPQHASSLSPASLSDPPSCFPYSLRLPNTEALPILDSKTQLPPIYRQWLKEMKKFLFSVHFWINSVIFCGNNLIIKMNFYLEY